MEGAWEAEATHMLLPYERDDNLALATVECMKMEGNITRGMDDYLKAINQSAGSTASIKRKPFIKHIIEAVRSRSFLWNCNSY